MSEKCDNQIAFLDPGEKISEFKEITRWIRESLIHRVVTFSTPVYKSGCSVLYSYHVYGCLLRMKCIGDIFSNQINKGDLPLRYKFLWHVLIQCISNRGGGYDMEGNDLDGLMVSLVLNKPLAYQSISSPT
ncbi:hypothetical protein Hanom_Chr09g00768121 [Helianthus anomalus]